MNGKRIILSTGLIQSKGGGGGEIYHNNNGGRTTPTVTVKERLGGGEKIHWSEKKFEGYVIKGDPVLYRVKKEGNGEIERGDWKREVSSSVSRRTFRKKEEENAAGERGS